MALFASTITSEAGLRLLLYPLGSNVVTRTACCTIGIGLPIYSTFKAIEEKDLSEQEKWLTYWAAYGSFSLVEFFSDKLIYCFHLGAKHLYMRHLRPFLLKRHARLDQIVDYLSDEIEKFISNHQGEIQFVKAVAIKCALTANQMVKDLIHPVQPQEPGRSIRQSPPGQTQASESEIDN